MVIVAYRIDARDQITAVNEGWSISAQANSAEHLLAPGILGRRLWDLISDPATAQIYQELVNRVRGGSGPVDFVFRCDSPGERRLLQMQITEVAEAGEILFEVSSIAVQPRLAVSLLDQTSPRSGIVLQMCGWCKRVPANPDSWLEIEQAVAELDLFAAPAMPAISHGICPDCHGAMLAVLAKPSSANSSPIGARALPQAISQSENG